MASESASLVHDALAGLDRHSDGRCDSRRRQDQIPTPAAPGRPVCSGRTGVVEEFLRANNPDNRKTARYDKRTWKPFEIRWQRLHLSCLEYPRLSLS
jgi:hypothetical protein